jgi:8-hydroxy-5-deazaflavin:NADPH oxidoreductase
MAERPRIGIIGEGEVGTHLEKGLKRAGYDVQTSGHDKNKVQQVAREAEIIICAVPHDQLENVVQELGDAHKGKILVDVTNVADDNMEYVGSLDESNAERFQNLARDAKVVKAFNTVFADKMDTGTLNGDRLSVFIAGDDEKGRKMIERLAEDIGFDAIDAGPLKNARYLETLGYLNMTLAFKQEMGNEIGFRLIHPDS